MFCPYPFHIGLYFILILKFQLLHFLIPFGDRFGKNPDWIRRHRSGYGIESYGCSGVDALSDESDESDDLKSKKVIWGEQIFLATRAED